MVIRNCPAHCHMYRVQGQKLDQDQRLQTTTHLSDHVHDHMTSRQHQPQKGWRFFAMLCKTVTQHGKTCCVNSTTRKKRYACIIEAHESTKTRIGKTQHRDLIAEKGLNLLSHYNLMHKPISKLVAIKFPNAKAAVDREWEKLEKLPAWKVTKFKSKNEVSEKAQNDGMTVHFCNISWTYLT